MAVHLRGYRSRSYIKVTGSRSKSQRVIKACLRIASFCNLKLVNLGSRWVTCSRVVCLRLKDNLVAAVLL